MTGVDHHYKKDHWKFFQSEEKFRIFLIDFLTPYCHVIKKDVSCKYKRKKGKIDLIAYLKQYNCYLGIELKQVPTTQSCRNARDQLTRYHKSIYNGPKPTLFCFIASFKLNKYDIRRQFWDYGFGVNKSGWEDLIYNNELHIAFPPNGAWKHTLSFTDSNYQPSLDISGVKITLEKDKVPEIINWCQRKWKESRGE